MNTYSDIIAEHQFHDRVKRATREIVACIENGDLPSVVEALQTHPFPKSIRFDEVVARAVVQKDVAIFDAVMEYIAHHTLKVTCKRYIRQGMTFACENDFVHALRCNFQESKQYISPSFYLHLLHHSTQHNSPECLQFVLGWPYTLETKHWVNLVGDAIVHICPDTLEILLSAPDEINEKERCLILSHLSAEHLKPLQHVLFDHFPLSEILPYTPLYRHDEVTHLYDAHAATRAQEQKSRIESELVSRHRLKERKL